MGKINGALKYAVKAPLTKPVNYFRHGSSGSLQYISLGVARITGVPFFIAQSLVGVVKPVFNWARRG
jgi:hypothetical protein